MSRTSTEIFTAVTDDWSRRGLGVSDATVSVYLTTIKSMLVALSEGGRMSDSAMVQILSQIWAALRWNAGFPVPYGPLWFPAPGGPLLPTYPPSPLTYELETLPLDVTGVTWTLVRAREYLMMANTYSRQLSDAWLDDPATLWSAASTEAAQHLFQVCYQYILNSDALPS